MFDTVQTKNDLNDRLFLPTLMHHPLT